MKKRQELPFTIYPSCPPFFLWSIWKRVDGIRSWPGGKEEKVSKQAQQGVCGGVPRCSRVWGGYPPAYFLLQTLKEQDPSLLSGVGAETVVRARPLPRSKQ